MQVHRAKNMSAERLRLHISILCSVYSNQLPLEAATAFLQTIRLFLTHSGTVGNSPQTKT